MTALDALLQCRCSDEMKEKVALAATECEMPVGEWLRAVVQSALNVHFSYEGDAEGVEVPEPAEDPDEYIAKLDEDAERLRAQEPGVPVVIHPGLHDPGPQERSPRDCPHMPMWRMGGICSKNLGGCGTRVSARPRVTMGLR